MLPSKTILEVNRKGRTCMLKAKVKAPPKNKAANAIEVEETEDNGSAHPHHLPVYHLIHS